VTCTPSRILLPLVAVLAAQLLGACRPDVGGGDGGSPPDMAAANDGGVPPGSGLLLIGTIVTPDQVIDGEVLVEGDKITCVAAGDQCSTATGAAGATVFDTKGIIAPGMIDTHNHILFDVFDEDDWTPSKVYTNHNDWTAEPRYAAMLDVKQCLVNDSQGKPTWCANTPYGTATGSLRCEFDKFGELKGLIAGTTSIVGLPGTSAACFGSVARSIDVSQNGLGTDSIQTSATFPPSKTSADGVCGNFADGSTTAYLIHCGEGTDARALAEFSTLSSVSTAAGCLLAPQTTITHGVAFTATEFTTMAQKGVKLTWSPASNVSLYAATADIPTALTAGVTVALAPDWSMGGSQNLLDEMRFADAWDNAHWSNRLSSKDLLAMTTTSAATVLALGDKIGQIAVGYYADLAVYSGDTANPYDAILAATPKDVQLVMVGGSVLYGDATLVGVQAHQPECEALDVCGVPKSLCIATADTSNKLNQTYVEIKAALDAALTAADAQTPTDGYNFAPLTPLVKCP
jgi:cytosine/adenosine deaminase-related metal-dependent hydrolase